MTKDCKDIEPRHNTKAHQQLFPQHTHKEKKKIILISGSKIWPNTVLYSESDVTYLVGKRDFTAIGRKGFFAQIYTRNSGFIIIIIIFFLTRICWQFEKSYNWAANANQPGALLVHGVSYIVCLVN